MEIDCVNIGKRSGAAKLLFQLILVLNWLKQIFPCKYHEANLDAL